jgi:hypothetical protein
MENLLINIGIILTAILIAAHSKSKFGKVNLPWTIGVPIYLYLSYAVMVSKYGTGGNDSAAALGGFIAQFIGFIVYWLFKGRLPAEKGAKQPANDWLIAFSFFMISGLAVPFIIYLIARRFLYLWLLMNGGASILFLVIALVEGLSYWAGILLSTRYVTKYYIIKSPRKIVNIATVFLAVSKVFSAVEQLRGSSAQAPYIIFSELVLVAVYYFLSKRSLHNNQ